MNLGYHPLDADVIVIGAGISGLVAAVTILEKEPSLQVFVLEATDRIGGRILSKPYSRSARYDLGGEWIGSEQKFLLSFLANHRIEVVKGAGCRPNSKTLVDYNGRIYQKTRRQIFDICNPVESYELTAFIKKIEKLCAGTQIDAYLERMTMEEFINMHVKLRTSRAILKYTILLYCGTSASNISVYFYIFFCISNHGIFYQLLTTEDGLHQYRIKKGAEEICNQLVAELPEDTVILKQPVIGISIKDRHVEITTEDDVFYYNIVIAIPSPATLRIKFTPNLPCLKLSALHDTIIGTLYKFVISYREPYWMKNGYCGDVYVINTDPNRPVLYCKAYSDGPNILSGYVLPVKNFKSLVLRQLRDYFGNDAMMHPLFFDWVEWKVGSPMNCCGSYDNLVVIQSNFKRIYWAGAETSLEWYGSIAGAVLSGIRAAHEVLYDLRPAVLTVSDTSLRIPSLENVRRSSTHYGTNEGNHVNLTSWYIVLPVVVLGTAGAYLIWRRFR